MVVDEEEADENQFSRELRMKQLKEEEIGLVPFPIGSSASGSDRSIDRQRAIKQEDGLVFCSAPYKNAKTITTEDARWLDLHDPTEAVESSRPSPVSVPPRALDGERQSVPPKSKSKSKSHTPVPDAVAPSPPAVAPSARYRYQEGKCLRRIYSRFDNCSSCVSRVSGHKCWFEGIRVFEYNEKGAIVGGPMFMTLQKRREEVQNEPEIFRSMDAFSRKLNGSEVWAVGRICADVVWQGLEKEIEHWEAGEKEGEAETVWKVQEVGERAMCDACWTGIWAGFWNCERCGRGFCFDCYSALKGGKEGNILEKCVGGRGKTARKRTSASFRRFNYFSKEELISLKTATEMMKLLPPAVNTTTELRMLPRSVPKRSHALPYIELSHVPSTNVFREIWSLGEAVVMKRIKYDEMLWKPLELVKRYGTEECTIHDCQTGVGTQGQVGDFLKLFGTPHANQVLKLKDWPPTQDFETSFPDLYEDFKTFVPVPDVTRKDGPLNVSAYCPENGNFPDLGPKMYLAFKSKKGKGGKGSTQLHMDIADAVNVMTFAINEDGTTGTAAWDIFPASSSDKIREFLYHYQAANPAFGCIGETAEERIADAKARFDDPIHTQHFYIDEEMLKTLSQDPWNVKAWRIEQKPGEAVFIPAGCAHQVCNMSDCIKVAIDFVSIENVERCKKLTGEFREQTRARLWREDVLRLRSMAYWGWRAREHYLAQGLKEPEQKMHSLSEAEHEELDAILAYGRCQYYIKGSIACISRLAAKLSGKPPPRTVSPQELQQTIERYKEKGKAIVKTFSAMENLLSDTQDRVRFERKLKEEMEKFAAEERDWSRIWPPSNADL
ncbi:hypothetical protein BT69DRAFT_197152 [Atractiella rhizophila]|nr:hypothetical protein BT69DRAFT_197152 [Atractiella rhizophila]